MYNVTMSDYHYLTRGEILRRLRDLIDEKGGPKKKRLKKLWKHAQVPYTSNTLERIHKLENVVLERPGITYRELREELRITTNALRDMVKQSRLVEERVITDRPGAYGRKPYGLWIKED